MTLNRSNLLVNRAQLLWALRSFFHAEQFLEIEAPTLVLSPGLEPQLDAFVVQSSYASRANPKRCWLHTSPEYALKRFLSNEGQQVQRVYSLGSCFRDELPSSSHSPEFTMLEWYARDLSLEELMSQCEALIQSLAQKASDLGFSQTVIQSDLPFERISVRDAFLLHAKVDLAKAQTIDLLKEQALAAGIRADGLHGSWDEVYFQIFMDLVEPKLGLTQPTFLFDFPASQAALAKLDPHDSRWARRFELFIGGQELANAFDELSDADEQRQRFLNDLGIRQQRAAQQPPLDFALLENLNALGQCVGIALGFDRLMMILLGATHINEVRLQAWEGL